MIEDGRFLHKKSRRILDTSSGPRDAKWIFVLSTSKNLYVGQVNTHRMHWGEKKEGSLEPRDSSSVHRVTSLSWIATSNGCRRKREHFSTLASSLAGPLLPLGDWSLRMEL